ncbi:transcription factor tau subunit sfc3 [Podospora aff. communis PSN243]|uniref:Transcription factor tau subunit sfc3 n=1 Tax=Podospora aff. communis PSN243 TaxID=3040156 RepID=A0AAV9H0T0_9PEZI|nr:transcription factor tau subunit sfc3 [Podospora aff. communis PSN243]
MTADGLEVLLEGLIPEIAYSGEIGVSITSLLKIVRQYHQTSLGDDADDQDHGFENSRAPQDDANLESSFSEAEMMSARWAWDWLRTRPQILINGNKRWNRLELSEVLALPEEDATDPALFSLSGEATPQKGPTGKPKKQLTKRPRIHPSEDLVWQTLARHGVDYKRVPVLEWKCLLGIASVRAEGILQSDLRRLVDQDKRSLPKRTDSLAKKGYIAKRTVVANKMKTSKLWLIDFAPPVPEDDKTGLDLSTKTLAKDLNPVSWHSRWTGDNVDVEAHARTLVAIVKAWGVMRYCDLRSKMGVGGKSSQMKTLAKSSQRFVDMGVLKYTAAAFPGSRKIFKDCLKFIREPRGDEWDKFLATGKKTSQYSDASRHREPKGNALALYGKSGQTDGDKGKGRAMAIRIFPGWAAEKPLSQNVFEVVKSAGPDGASNPQVSVATVGYSFRRYMASHLTKLAETQQPAHLKKFQVVSKLVRAGKTSAYMFSVPEPENMVPPVTEANENEAGSAYGFGSIRPKGFPRVKTLSVSDLCVSARRNNPLLRRKGRMINLAEKEARTLSRSATVDSSRPTPTPDTGLGLEIQSSAGTPGGNGSLDGREAIAADATEPGIAAANTPVGLAPLTGPPGAFIGEPGSLHPRGRGKRRPAQSAVIVIRSERLRSPSFQSSLKEQPTDAPANEQGRNGLVQDARGGAQPEDWKLIVRYNETAGILQLSRADRSLVYRTASAPYDKEPLAIRIDDVHDGPAIREVPGGTDCSIVLVAKSAGDDSPPSTYGFIFSKGDGNKEKATAIQDGVAEVKSGGRAPQVASAEPLASQDVADETLRSGPTRGRGRGRGGRGRGKKGQAATAKVWRCDKCGGTWKNDIGLKYHQTKAQTPCNPEFDPASLVERSRKRRRMSPIPPTPVVGSDEEGEEPASLHEAKRIKKAASASVHQYSVVRNAVRARQNPQLAFRGLTSDGARSPAVAEESKVIHPRMWTPTPRATDSPFPVGPSSAALPSQANSPAIQQSQAYSQPGQAFYKSALEQPGEPFYESALATRTVNNSTVPPPQPISPSPEQNVGTNNEVPHEYGGAQVHNEGYQGYYVVDSTQGVPQNHGNGHHHQNGDPGAPSPEAFPGETAPYNVQPLYPALPGEEGAYVGNIGGGGTTIPMLGVEDQGEVVYPFKPATSYDRIPTEPKRRTAQAVDIINHLLDNNDGVFPGDKALFYAITKVYLKEFRGEIPPTWKNFHAAIKTLDVRKLATVHTHMLRTERGKLLTCTILIRNGVDPTGPIPTAVKQKMRDAFPGVYIPPAFSPTEEELLLLEEYGKGEDPQKGDGEKDKGKEKPNKNGQKFRSRRKIDEVEVFNAPYYTQGLYNGNNEESLETIDHSLLPGPPQAGLETRKRRIPDDLAGSPSAKRPRAYHEPADIGDPSVDATDDQSQDPRDAPYFPAGARRGRRARSKYNTPGAGVLEPQTVLDAIKTYGLLPTKAGKRRVYDAGGFGIRSLDKFPNTLGKARNPGLSSLPPWFYGNTAPKFEAPATKFRFLAPNTGLSDAPEDWGVGETSTAPESSEKNGLSIVGPTARSEKTYETVEFVPPTEFEETARGVWSCPGLKEFEIDLDTSVALKGWMPSRLDSLLDNLPTSLEDMGKKIKGHPWKSTETWLDQDYARFFIKVQRCKMWELSQQGHLLSVLGGSIAPSHHFINLSPPEHKVNTRPVQLRWSDERQYDLETLPYEFLEDDDDDEVLYPSAPPKRKAPKKVAEPRPLKRQRIAKITEKNMGMVRGSKFKLPAIKTARELTSFPRTAHDFLRAPAGDGDEDLDWTSENVRLTAFVVVTTLLGGVDRIVDWGLMLRLFPDMTISQLRHLWCALKKDRQSTIVNLTAKFRRAFLKDYADNKLAPIDFENTLAYDWKGLIKWATKLDGTQRENIPATRKDVTDEYILEDCKYENREWRESYYHLQRSVFNRFQDASSEALAAPADQVATASPDMDMVVAISWTRSLCVTPIETYPTDMVIKQRESLFPNRPKAEIPKLMHKSIDLLQKDGVLSRSTSKWSNGRRWRFNNRVPDTLVKVAKVDMLTQAVEFKRELDKAFRADGRKRVSYITNDGMMLALFNLQATGRVRLETTGQPNVPMGHEPGNYETRKYTKKYLHFRVDAVPTESYLYDDHPHLMAARERLRAMDPPSVGPQGAIPVWCDVFRKVDSTRWLQYLAAVLLTIASRGAMQADELVKTLKPTIMLFEVEMLLDWAQEMGLLEVQMDGTAPAAREWWWMALEAQKERLEATSKPRKMLPGQRRRPEGMEKGEEDDLF